ncbi:MAG: hypothetical protein KGL39_13720 [Patescibacteria group bacterium]|nr:hypothetical protein [Patescibacteria group bacterium]
MTKSKMAWDWVHEIGEKWLKVGLSTETAKWNVAATAIRELYRIGRIKPPTKIIRVHSPLVGELVCSVLRESHPELLNELRWDQGNKLHHFIWGQVRRCGFGEKNGKLWKDVRLKLFSSAWGRVFPEGGRHIGAQVNADRSDGVVESVKSKVASILPGSKNRKLASEAAKAGEHLPFLSYGMHGQFNAALMAEYEVAMKLTKQSSAVFDAMQEVVKSCSFWWPVSSVVVICDRPTIFEHDESNCLHCSTGPAIKYGDKWGVYAWHGTRVPSHVIERPNSISLSAIAEEPEAAIRRVMLERYEAKTYLTEIIGAKELCRPCEWSAK